MSPRSGSPSRRTGVRSGDKYKNQQKTLPFQCKEQKNEKTVNYLLTGEGELRKNRPPDDGNIPDSALFDIVDCC
jgi:hypothetical protein